MKGLKVIKYGTDGTNLVQITALEVKGGSIFSIPQTYTRPEIVYRISGLKDELAKWEGLLATMDELIAEWEATEK